MQVTTQFASVLVRDLTGHAILSCDWTETTDAGAFAFSATLPVSPVTAGIFASFVAKVKVGLIIYRLAEERFLPVTLRLRYELVSGGSNGMDLDRFLDTRTGNVVTREEAQALIAAVAARK